MKTDKKMETENKKAFIHISDLHVALQSEKLESKNYKLIEESRDSEEYIKKFVDFVLNNYINYEFYLLVTGDIVDRGAKGAYAHARIYLNQIIKKLKIEKKNVLIVPGNHDVDLSTYRSILNNEGPIVQANQDKYNLFKNCFYDIFFSDQKKQFDKTKQIVDCLKLEKEKILIVGINSNYKVVQEENSDICSEGAVEVNSFSQELENICGEAKNDLVRIAIFHHNCISKSASYGRWDMDSWRSVRLKLEKKQFDILMFGNEHELNDSSSESDFYKSAVGSFAQVGKDREGNTIRCSFKIYELCKDEKEISLKGRKYEYNEEWEKLGEDQEIVLYEEKNNTKNNLDVEDILENETNNQEEPQEEPQEEKDVQVIGSKEFQDQMMSIIKSERLFHPGHFHRGKDECSRTHHWIDTISLLNKKDYRDKIQKELQRVYDGIEDNKKNKFDAIIGVGMEGNVMSTILQVKDIYYTYTPYPYRDNFNEYEKGISFPQENYKNVLIITDVINEGKMLKDIIEKEKDIFFNKVTNIYVVSLFYTGKKEKGKGKVLDELTRLVKEKGKTIDIRSLIHLEVGKCLYADNENFKEECEVYKHELCEIYKF